MNLGRENKYLPEASQNKDNRIHLKILHLTMQSNFDVEYKH